MLKETILDHARGQMDHLLSNDGQTRSCS